MTSLTRTDTARMPSGMTGGSPAPASFEASLPVRIGSFLTTEMIRPRPTSSFACEKVPSGAWPAGKLTTVKSSFFSSAPSCRSAAATTTGWVATAAVFTGWFWTRLYVPYASPPPARMAIARTAKIRLRIVSSLAFVPHERDRLHGERFAGGAALGDQLGDAVQDHETEWIVDGDLRGGVGAERHVPLDHDTGGRVLRQSAGLHVVLHRCLHVGVRLVDQDRLPRALPRRVGQHLPRLIGAAELEDAHRDQQNDRNGDGRLDQRGAALVPAKICAHRRHGSLSLKDLHSS